MEYDKLFDIKGKFALIAGAGELGREMAAGLAQYGAKLIVTDISEDAVRETRAYVQGLGGDVRGKRCDIMKNEELADLVDEIKQKEGGLDIMINSIGAIVRNPVLEQADDEWQRIVDLNLTGAMRLTRASVPLMKARGKGKIIHVSSAVGILAYPDFSAYASSKAGLNMLIKVSAMEFAPMGINVNGIAPGTAITKLNREYYAEDESRVKAKIKKIPAGRLASKGDFVGAAVFLSSAASDYIHGVTIPIDGGRTICG
jgi:NAD(P)-dependent dehydrogenase (short-subunit alcohol dehydrogenase family)